jgi:hypothetical protein
VDDFTVKSQIILSSSSWWGLWQSLSTRTIRKKPSAGLLWAPSQVGGTVAVAAAGRGLGEVHLGRNTSDRNNLGKVLCHL